MSIELVADELAKHINGGSYSMRAVAKVPPDIPEVDFKELNGMSLQVYPFEATEERAGRDEVVVDTIVIEVLISRKLDDTTKRRHMIAFFDELRDRISHKNFAVNGSAYSWQETALTALWDATILRERNVYTGMMRATYRTMK